MKGDYVLNGLIQKRASLAGEAESLHKRLRQIIRDIEHMDATIIQFSSDFRVETIRAKAFRPPLD